MGKEREKNFEANLRERYGIPFSSCVEEIKEEISTLLDNPLTAVDAAEIVLGREIGEKDTHIINLAISHLTIESKFEKLVAQRKHEDLVRSLPNNGKV